MAFLKISHILLLSGTPMASWGSSVRVPHNLRQSASLCQGPTWPLSRSHVVSFKVPHGLRQGPTWPPSACHMTSVRVPPSIRVLHDLHQGPTWPPSGSYMVSIRVPHDLHQGPTWPPSGSHMVSVRVPHDLHQGASLCQGTTWPLSRSYMVSIRVPHDLHQGPTWPLWGCLPSSGSQMTSVRVPPSVRVQHGLRQGHTCLTLNPIHNIYTLKSYEYIYLTDKNLSFHKKPSLIFTSVLIGNWFKVYRISGYTILFQY